MIIAKMAAPLKCLFGSLRNTPSLNYGWLHSSVRCASKKAGGSTKNKQEKTKSKNRGPKKSEGDYVEKGMILYRQLGLKVYPGENVGCGRDLTLYALESGQVVLSREKLSPYPKSPLFEAVQGGMELYKIFYNIIPDPQPKTFKLVSQT